VQELPEHGHHDAEELAILSELDIREAKLCHYGLTKNTNSISNFGLHSFWNLLFLQSYKNTKRKKVKKRKCSGQGIFPPPSTGWWKHPELSSQSLSINLDY
jgi:hypothetical protein